MPSTAHQMDFWGDIGRPTDTATIRDWARFTKGNKYDFTVLWKGKSTMKFCDQRGLIPKIDITTYLTDELHWAVTTCAKQPRSRAWLMRNCHQRRYKQFMPQKYLENKSPAELDAYKKEIYAKHQLKKNPDWVSMGVSKGRKINHNKPSKTLLLELEKGAWEESLTICPPENNSRIAGKIVTGATHQFIKLTHSDPEREANRILLAKSMGLGFGLRNKMIRYLPVIRGVKSTRVDKPDQRCLGIAFRYWKKHFRKSEWESDITLAFDGDNTGDQDFSLDSCFLLNVTLFPYNQLDIVECKIFIILVIARKLNP